MALNLAHFVRWTLRDKAAQRRLALYYATNSKPNCWLAKLFADRCKTILLRLDYNRTIARHPKPTIRMPVSFSRFI
jgi:hypothetical protein